MGPYYVIIKRRAPQLVLCMDRQLSTVSERVRDGHHGGQGWALTRGRPEAGHQGEASTLYTERQRQE